LAGCAIVATSTPPSTSTWSKTRVALAALTIGAGAVTFVGQRVIVTGDPVVVSAAQKEGYRGQAYPDPATKGAPWTIGFGETHGVKPGDRTTPTSALRVLEQSLERHAAGVRACVKVPLSVGEFRASVDLAYNIGVAAYCNSSVARRFNAGDYWGGCMAFLLYIKARVGGVLQPMPGLVKRRWDNYNLCVTE
jgi:lysozyme